MRESNTSSKVADGRWGLGRHAVWFSQARGSRVHDVSPADDVMIFAQGGFIGTPRDDSPPPFKV